MKGTKVSAKYNAAAAAIVPPGTFTLDFVESWSCSQVDDKCMVLGCLDPAGRHSNEIIW